MNFPHDVGFHSIGIPSEWGQVVRFDSNTFTLSSQVSIQLGSPASGDIAAAGTYDLSGWTVSIQLGSPASGDVKTIGDKIITQMFPFNWDPQRVGTLPY